MSRRLLVTGGAGFIGANFVARRLARFPDERLVVVDLLTYAGNPANLASAAGHEAYRFVRADVRDRKRMAELLREERLDTIVHFAAESHVDRSIGDPSLFVDVNVGGTQALLEAAREAWLDAGGVPHRFHQVSTDEVYGSLAMDDPAVTELVRLAPNSPYAASKAAADHLVRAYGRTYGLQATVSRSSNNYGPYQFPEKLVPLTIVHLLTGRRVPVYGRGDNVRDWIHVEDHCLGIDRVLERGRAGACYNLGGGGEITNLELVQRLCGLLDETFAARPELAERFPQAPPALGEPSAEWIDFVSDRPGHDLRYALDGARAAAELDFSPGRSFAAGLAETLDWYVQQTPWWRAILDGSYRAPAAAV